MENAEFELLVAILKQATRQLVAVLLERFADAGRKARVAIKQAAVTALEWVRSMCRGASRYVRESLAGVKSAMQELIAAAKAQLAVRAPAAG